MAKAELEATYRQRARLLEHARELARTGAHADHRSILPRLEALDGFSEARSRLEDRVFCAQLDGICAKVREPSVSRIDLQELRQSHATVGSATPNNMRRSRS